VQIGSHTIEPALILAPMAGITDKPMRRLCRRYGAGYAVSEMIAADASLWQTGKSVRRRDHAGEPGPIGVQIAGADPAMLAEAARFNVDQGAGIIDINMGCPVKKVLKAWAGSALLDDEALVGRILDAVVAAVAVPVTLKIRTGPTDARRNGVAIARIAEQAGVAALAVHGRTREQRFRGEAEYETIAAIRDAVSLPLIANGDVTDIAHARRVLAHTGADALMLGRGAQGRPWVFRELAAALSNRPVPAEPDAVELGKVLHEHLTGLYALYGDRQGVRVARKHIGWYLAGRPRAEVWRRAINRVETPREQLGLIDDYLERLANAAAMMGGTAATLGGATATMGRAAA
jgi:tRNA-dihydrouridine synthase B